MPAIFGVPFGRWERSSSTGGSASGGELPTTPTVDLPSLDVKFLMREQSVKDLGLEKAAAMKMA